MHYYDIAPLQLVRPDSYKFTYSSHQDLQVGRLVVISVGKKNMTGLVLAKVPRPRFVVKPIESELNHPIVPSHLIKIAEWMSQYYATHLSAVLQSILPSGLTKKRRSSPKSDQSIKRKRINFLLNKYQTKAINEINSMSPGTAILHGVTGSGKTAVYIEATKQTIKAGRSAIILIPEIALTAQLVGEYSNHFDNVHVTHSGQTESERHRTWLAIADSDDPVIVIGPRSAVFMPVANLGLIVIDEAHEPSYKQDVSPKYSTLRVASMLANYCQAKVVQGSATPSISEYMLAMNNHRPIITLPETAIKDAVTPSVSIVDMTNRANFDQHRFLSSLLLKKIDRAIETNNQVLIFHNRRGSASMTLCENCGWSALCKLCFVPMVLHIDKHLLICHICGRSETVPTSCQVCSSTNIIHKGIGTKLIEAELKKLYPKTVIMRFDGDSSAENTVDKQYQQIYGGKIQIIVGTQVVAKGLDLPHLNTVGIIQADTGLALPDYTAHERVFQLLAQAIGRVGRTATETSVVVQSYQPDSFAIKYGSAQNYQEFYNHTLAERKNSLFPPFCFLLKLTCSYKTESIAIKNSIALANKIKKNHDGVQTLGPTPAFYERKHDNYRWQIIVKSKHRHKLVEILDILPSSNWRFDLDPSTLL